MASPAKIGSSPSGLQKFLTGDLFYSSRTPVFINLVILDDVGRLAPNSGT